MIKRKVPLIGTSVVIDVDEAEPLFGNHIREAWRTLFGKSKNQIPFTRNSIKQYLRRCIKAWEKKELKAENFEDSLMAKTYIEALRSVQTALFGKGN